MNTTKKTHGFARGELMVMAVTIVLVFVVMAIVVSTILGARLRANEESAILALRAICDAQGGYQDQQFADADGDRVGEYGDFPALAAARYPASRDPLLSVSFFVTAGAYKRGGYHFRVEVGDSAGPSNVNSRETSWAAYAWPSVLGETGNHTYSIDRFGEVTQTLSTVFNPDGSRRSSDEVKWTIVSRFKTE